MPKNTMVGYFDTNALIKWLGNDRRQESLLIKEAPISKSTLAVLRRGYTPSIRTAKAIIAVMLAFPPASSEKEAAA